MNYQVIQARVPNEKGLLLATEIYKPNIGGTLPTIFIFHGFMGYKESTDLVDVAHRLSEKGFVTVRFTSSGFGDSQGDLDHDYRFSEYRRDADVIHRYVSTLPYVNVSRFGVYGQSMGGKLTVLFTQHHPDIRVFCVVSGPVSFVGTLYEQLRPDWKKLGYFERKSGRDGRVIRIPYAYYTDEEKSEHDVLVAAGELTHSHALVIAGNADTEVPWQETKRVFAALNCPKEFLLLEGVEHKYKYQKGLFPIVHKPVINFFEKYL